MTHNPSRRQQAAKWAAKASLFAANQYLKRKQQHTETPQNTEENSDPKVSEAPQDTEEKQDQASRRSKALQWGKQASLFAASEYLRRNNQQPSEQKKLTPMETFLEILNTAAFGVSVLAAILLFLLIRFGLGQH